MAEPQNFHDLHRRPFPRLARAGQDNAQSISSSVNTTIIWNLEFCDTDGLYNPATGVYTCAVDGWYQVQAAILFTSTNTFACGEQIRLEARVAGGTVAYLWYNEEFACTTTDNHQARGMAVIEANAGQAITFVIRQTSGGALTLVANSLHNHMSIQFISPDTTT